MVKLCLVCQISVISHQANGEMEVKLVLTPSILEGSSGLGRTTYLRGRGKWVWNSGRILLSVCLSVYLSIYIYISIHLSIYVRISVYLSRYICIYIHPSIYVCLSISIYVCLSTYLYIYLSIYLCIYIHPSMYICLSLYLSIYLSTYLAICLYMSVCLSQHVPWGCNTSYTQKCTTASGQVMWISRQSIPCTRIPWGRRTVE
jgi:hypothetical protein